MGKGGNATDATNAKTHEVLIDGRLYDVTDFKHPGGSVIKFLTDHGDATDAFAEFHNRLAKAQKMLKALPSREAPAEVLKERGANGQPDLAKDFAAFRDELTAEGYYKPSPLHVLYRIAEVIVMHLVGGYLFMTSPSPVMQALGVVILGITSGRCGWLMHEGGHYSLTGTIKVDRALQVILFGVGCGMSGAWWRIQHNKHHATPQKLQHDVDLDTLPLVAFHEKVAAKAKHPLMKKWIRLQAFMFTPFSCLLVTLSWQYFLHPRHIVRTKRVTSEGLAIVVRHFLFYGFLCAGMSWGAAIQTYLVYNMVAGAYIFTQFAMSHTHLPVSEADDYLHWVEYAAKHTTNIKPGPLKWVNWWMSFLNFQIEHHLFPGMPQYRFPKISRRVKAFFEAHGLHYDQRDYFSCLADTWANLQHVAESVDKQPAGKKKN